MPAAVRGAMRRFDDGSFSFVVCVGDALSFVRDRREHALGELVRVARSGAVLILGGDSLYGFMRMAIDEGRLGLFIEALNPRPAVLPSPSSENESFRYSPPRCSPAFPPR